MEIIEVLFGIAVLIGMFALKLGGIAGMINAGNYFEGKTN